MPTIDIQSGRLRLTILPRLGAGIALFAVRDASGKWQPLMRPAPADAAWFNDLACYLLAPWSNRIAGAAFAFQGRRHALRPDWTDGTAVHGDVKHRPWHILDRSPLSARLALESAQADSPNWPWPYRAEVRYELSETTLAVDLSVRNRGSEPFPAGLGFHPFWLRRLGSAPEDAVVTLPNRGRYPAQGMIPVGPAAPDAASRSLAAGVPLGTLELDDVFAGAGGNASIHWPASGVRIEYNCSPSLSHGVVYSPRNAAGPLPYFCLEPVTMVNDGFNLMARDMPGTGVAVLKPGEALAARWEMRVSLSSPAP